MNKKSNKKKYVDNSSAYDWRLFLVNRVIDGGLREKKNRSLCVCVLYAELRNEKCYLICYIGSYRITVNIINLCKCSAFTITMFCAEYAQIITFVYSRMTIQIQSLLNLIAHIKLKNIHSYYIINKFTSKSILLRMYFNEVAATNELPLSRTKGQKYTLAR